MLKIKEILNFISYFCPNIVLKLAKDLIYTKYILINFIIYIVKVKFFFSTLEYYNQYHILDIFYLDTDFCINVEKPEFQELN